MTMLEKAVGDAGLVLDGQLGAGHNVSVEAVVLAVLRAIREPDEAMRNAARDWSNEKYGKPVGRDGTDGCWTAQIDAIASDVGGKVNTGTEKTDG